MNAKEEFDADDVAKEICRNHIQSFDNQWADWFAYTGYKTVRECVGKIITQQAKTIRKQNGKQFNFNGAGFDHIEDYYILKRDGKNRAVPAVKTDGSSGPTYSEWTAIANVLIAEGKTKQLHGQEVLTLRDMLFSEAPSAVVDP